MMLIRILSSRSENQQLFLGAFLVFAVLALGMPWKNVSADDTFTCCMAGWKSVRNIVLCDAPCCPGYAVKKADPPLFRPLVYCVKEKKVGKPIRSTVAKRNPLSPELLTADWNEKSQDMPMRWNEYMSL